MTDYSDYEIDSFYKTFKKSIIKSFLTLPIKILFVNHATSSNFIRL